MTSCETRYMWSGFVGSRQRNNMICTRSVRRVIWGVGLATIRVWSSPMVLVYRGSDPADVSVYGDQITKKIQYTPPTISAQLPLRCTFLTVFH